MDDTIDEGWELIDSSNRVPTREEKSSQDDFITIRVIKGENTKSVIIDRIIKVENLINKIEDFASQHSNKRIRWIYKGKQLKETMRICDYDVQENDILHCHISAIPDIDHEKMENETPNFKLPELTPVMKMILIFGFILIILWVVVAIYPQFVALPSRILLVLLTLLHCYFLSKNI